MSRKICILILTAMIIFIFIIIGITMILLNNNDNSTNKTNQKYILKQYEDNLGIFIEGENKPISTIDVPYYSLPFEDKQLLNEGIYADSLSEIMLKAEDYER